MQARGVLGVSLIRFLHQLTVESPLTDTGLITSGQENRIPVGVKGESHSPHAPISIEPQFFHSGILGQLQVIHIGTSQQRSLGLQQSRSLQKRLPNGFRQRIEFGFDFRMKSNHKLHRQIMILGRFTVKRAR